MGLHADAVELAKLTGKDVKECKKALKTAGDTLRKMTIVEKAMYLKFLDSPKAPKPPKPAPKPAPKPTVKVKPPVEVKKATPPAPPVVKKAIDPKPEKTVKPKKIEKQVLETHDDEDMSAQVKDD